MNNLWAPIENKLVTTFFCCSRFRATSYLFYIFTNLVMRSFADIFEAPRRTLSRARLTNVSGKQKKTTTDRVDVCDSFDELPK